MRRARLFRIGTVVSAVFSPNGKRIALTSSGDGDFDIYVMNADGSAIKKLTNNTAIDGAPDWSPDGRRIVYHRHGAPRHAPRNAWA